MTNEAFAHVKIDALLAAQARNTQDKNAVRFEVLLLAPLPPEKVSHGDQKESEKRRLPHETLRE